MIRLHRLTLLGLFLTVMCAGSALTAWAQDAKELNRRGQLARQSGNYKESMELLKQAMKLEPGWAEPYYNVYQLLKLVNKPEDSRRALKKAYELEPTNRTYQEEYGKLLKEDLKAAEAKKDQAAIDALRKQITSVNPSELGLAADMVADLYKKKDLAGVKRLAKELLEKNKAQLAQYDDPSLGRIFLLLARAEFDTNELKPAKEHAEKAANYPIEDPDEAKALVGRVKQALQEEVAGHLRLGKSFSQKGETVAALAEFNKALAVDPQNDEAQSLIAELQAKADAKDLLAEVKKKSGQQKWLEVRDLLEVVVQNDPKNAEARTLLKKAVSIEEEALKKVGLTDKFPRDLIGLTDMVDSFLSKGKRFLEAGNKKDARQFFDRALVVITLNPDLEKLREAVDVEVKKITSAEDRRSMYEKATRELYKTGDWEECLKLLEQLPQDYEPDMLSFMAYCHWKLGNLDKAVDMAHIQLNRQSENNRARFVLGNIFHERGDNTAAYKYLNEIKQSDPDYPGIDDVLMKVGAIKWGPLVIPVVAIVLLLWIAYIIYNNLDEYKKNSMIKKGRSFLNRGYPRECIEELLKAKKLPNLDQYDGAVISRLLAQAYLKTGQYEKSVGECKHLLSINMNDQEAHTWLGFCFLGLRRLNPESLPELLNLYKTEKNNQALIGLLGTHYASQKVLMPEGVEILEKWLDNEPNNPDVLKTLGKFYLAKGRSDERSMKVFEQMMTSQKVDVDFVLGVAKMHLRLKRYDACLKSCETVLSMDVNNDLVHQVLREAYREMGRIEELLEIYRGFLAENPYNVAFQKGLTEAKKAFEKQGGRPAATESAPAEPIGAPEAAVEATGEAGEEILCPHCQKPNNKADYYCQHCGKNIV
ncbi:MAG TPA: tetratricopeptide repeat protein [Candidatus Ozemobacteraceae bacterium]|nr:tetratricopeptide repeat protein [Candidatus Ozemobacteraceae bacterium]